jgi:hypothetical protein
MSDKKYTQEDLKGMARVDLRRTAIAVLGIDNKECSNTTSGELITRILQAQEGGKGKSKDNGKQEGRGRGRAAAGRAPAAGRGRAAKEEPPQESAGGGDPSVDEVLRRIDAVGKTVDESTEELKSTIETLEADLTEARRQLYMIFGLLTDVYKAVDEPDALEARVEELQEEWDAQGNDDSGD